MKIVTGWRPHGVAGWLLSILAIGLAVALTATAFAMSYPVPFDSAPGLLATVLLAFPLHLLMVAAVALALAFLARALRARLAARALMLAALLAGVMGLWSSFAMWRFASREGVQVSLADYLDNAGHLNLGPPQLGRTVAYGTAPDGAELLLDVWRSATAAGGTPRPALIRIHGGAFIRGNRSDIPDWNRWFNALGYTVFDIDYRLPPPVRWRDEIGDVKCALGWVAAHAKEYGIDPARIGVTGFSAGATLAMLAAYSMGNPALPPSCAAAPVTIRSVINLYGNPDVPGLYDTSPSLALVHDAAGRYVGGSPAEYPERHRAVSPMTYIDASSPPTISFLGSNDRILPTAQLTDLDKALKQAGVPSEAYLLPATDHGFDMNWGGFATQFARSKIALFLERYR